MNGVVFGATVEEGIFTKQGKSISFSDYPVSIYRGNLSKPDSFRQDIDGSWKDKFGERIRKPIINFSGKYFVSVHRCGGPCFYYKIHDMSTGKELSLLDMFAFADNPPKTRDGWTYSSNLYYKPNSRLLVVQYQLEKWMIQANGESELKSDCRERLFILDNEQLEPITETRYYCTDMQ
jgi:hypothetical protein